MVKKVENNNNVEALFFTDSTIVETKVEETKVSVASPCYEMYY